ncbi:mechanosensitive ion channel family protein [Frigidibacter sp. MR17.24]|uniref:mechanosensitive ion channel family protein n=1 Tax=Frigidibacter sp. MR17.24 TaxID=3127345 RepID=UPI003012B610
MIRARFLIAPFLACLLAATPLAAQQEGAAPEGDNPGWYESDELDPGQAEPAAPIDHSTPRAMVSSFLDRADAGDWKTAAWLLNLTFLPEDERATRGPVLARELATVIDRRLWIDWQSLPGRPDAVIEDETGQNPQAGTVRRSLVLATLETGQRVYDLRIARYREPDGDLKWAFAPDTIENVPLLFDAFGPRWFEAWLPPWAQDRFAGLRAWEWVFLPLMLVVLFGVGVGVRRLVIRLSGRFQRPYLRRAAAAAATPLALVVATAGAQALSGLVVSFSGPTITILAPALTILMAAGLGLAALRVVDGVLDHVSRRYVGEISDARSVKERELYTSIYALRRVIILATVAFSLIVLLVRLNIFETMGMTLLASAGVLTVVLGIAGQAVLGNILASLQIALARPVRIGDTVVYEGQFGHVEAIFYTFLRIRLWDERSLIVPVKHFVSQPIENWSVGNARIIKRVDLLLDLAADTDALRAAYLRLAADIPQMVSQDEMKMQIIGQDDRGVTVGFYGYADDPASSWDLECNLREVMLTYVRTEHPDWLPQDRFRASDAGAAGARTAD